MHKTDFFSLEIQKSFEFKGSDNVRLRLQLVYCPKSVRVILIGPWPDVMGIKTHPQNIDPTATPNNLFTCSEFG